LVASRGPPGAALFRSRRPSVQATSCRRRPLRSDDGPKPGPKIPPSIAGQPRGCGTCRRFQRFPAFQHYRAGREPFQDPSTVGSLAPTDSEPVSPSRDALPVPVSRRPRSRGHLSSRHRRFRAEGAAEHSPGQLPSLSGRTERSDVGVLFPMRASCPPRRIPQPRGFGIGRPGGPSRRGRCPQRVPPIDRSRNLDKLTAVSGALRREPLN
jgi:hypothetical protein